MENTQKNTAVVDGGDPNQDLATKSGNTAVAIELHVNSTSTPKGKLTKSNLLLIH